MWTCKYWLIDALFNLNLTVFHTILSNVHAFCFGTSSVSSSLMSRMLVLLWEKKNNKKLNYAFCAVSQCLIYRAAWFNEWLKTASWGHKRSKSPSREGYLTSLISTKCKAKRYLTKDQPSLLYHSWGNYTFTWLNHFWRMWTGDSNVVNQVAHLNSNTPRIKTFSWYLRLHNVWQGSWWK